MKDFKTFIENISVKENLLVPRNLEGRKEKLKQMNIKLLSQEVIDEWTEIPVWLKDVEIECDFYCDHNQLTSLEGCPETVGKGFSCSYNKLISLEGCPVFIGGNFWCGNNKDKLKLPDFVELKGEFIN